MDRSEIAGLYYIAHTNNLISILNSGILCYNKACTMHPLSIADESIQNRRRKVVIPGPNRRLHDYANLYFNPRNPMMFKIKDQHKHLCVLEIDQSVLDLRGVVISDKNASSDYVRFSDSPEGLELLDENLVYAKDWTHSQRIEYYKRKSAVCAEVLVPISVQPQLIKGIYVSSKSSYREVKTLLTNHSCSYKIVINAGMFFKEPKWLKSLLGIFSNRKHKP